MKVRQGFVSNSSSSSFMIFGKYYHINEMRKIFGEDFCVWNNPTDLWMESDEYDNGVYIGLRPDEMNKDKTLEQLAEGLIFKMKEAGLEVTVDEIEFHCEGWYNG